MKTGQSLKDVVTELARQRSAKRDFMADTRNIVVAAPKEEGQPMTLAIKGNHPLAIRPFALRQMEDHVGVPAKFADRLLAKHPDLLVHNLNELLHRDPTERMVRTLDNGMRAFLSRSYRRIDNYDFAEAVLSVCNGFKISIESCQVTESRLYIKIIRTDMEHKIGFKQGWQIGQGHNFFQRIRPAAIFSNSEVGSGSLWFRDGIWTKECTNLAVFEDKSFERVHLGRKASAGDEGLLELMSDQTKALEDATLWSQVKDLAANALGGANFQKRIEQLEASTTNRIEGDPAKTVELTADHFTLNDQERGGLLRHLIEGGDLSQYGLHSAMTRMSADVVDYDRATELERMGGKIIELPKSDWKVLAEAA
jgi:hypothetical protein